MIEHNWSVLCERTVIDKDTNNMSLHNVIEQIGVGVPGGLSADKVSVVPISLELVNLWSRSDYGQPVSGTVRVNFCSPTREVLFSQQIEINLQTHIRTRSRLRLFPLTLKQAGLYSFEVSFLDSDNWKVVANLPLQIVSQPVPSIPGS